LIASPRFFEKRIGYLILSVILDENDDLLTLVPNTLNNDLQHHNSLVNSLALTAIATIADADTIRQLLPSIQNCFKHEQQFIRKKVFFKKKI
jgi:AP-1 complex subunit gamma-1